MIHDGEPRASAACCATPACDEEVWRLPAELAERPGGPAPAFTADDLLDFHLLLQGDDWATLASRADTSHRRERRYDPPARVRESEGRPVSLGPPEILVMLVIALLVFGPHRLPEVGRQVGRTMRELRKFQQDMRHDLDEMLGHDDDRRLATAAKPAAEPPAEHRRVASVKHRAASPPPEHRPTTLIRTVSTRDPDGRMTVVEHLAELRRRLMISIVAVAVDGGDLLHLRAGDHRLASSILHATPPTASATRSSSPARSTPS